MSECLRPFKIVEDFGFCEFCVVLNLLRSRFELPAKNKHRQQMIELTESVMEKVKRAIDKEIEYYSITMDLWSPRVMQSLWP